MHRRCAARYRACTRTARVPIEPTEDAVLPFSGLPDPVRPAAAGSCILGSSRGRIDLASRGRGIRRDDRVFCGAHAPRFPLYRHRRRRRGRRRRGLAADRPDEPGRLDHRRWRADRSRSRRRSPEVRSSRCSGAASRSSSASHQEGDRGGARTSSCRRLPDPETDAARIKEGHEQWLVMIGICTHLGCIPLGESGRIRRLVLPVPRLGLRHLRPHPQRPGAEEPGVPPYEFVSDTKIQIG